MSNNDDRHFYRVLHRAYIRDGTVENTGEALLLACLLHAKGAGRNSDDMQDVRRIMKDKNLKRERP